MNNHETKNEVIEDLGALRKRGLREGRKVMSERGWESERIAERMEVFHEAWFKTNTWRIKDANKAYEELPEISINKQIEKEST